MSDHHLDARPNAGQLNLIGPELVNVETIGTVTQRLERLLAGSRFRFSNERELQEGLALALTDRGLIFSREHSLDAHSRVDFLVSPCIAVEIKIAGSQMALLRQAQRYAMHTAVHSILVVGTPAWLLRLPATIGGKPLLGHRLLSSLL